jgi:hypothetical protein
MCSWVAARLTSKDERGPRASLAACSDVFACSSVSWACGWGEGERELDRKAGDDTGILLIYKNLTIYYCTEFCQKKWQHSSIKNRIANSQNCN